MNISKNGIEFLKFVEGFEKFEYPDVEGNPTIGVGHLLTRSELTSGKILIANSTTSAYVKYKNGLTDNQVNDLLLMDVRWCTVAVNGYTKAMLEQYQFDTLISFCFNVGADAYKNSTLLKLLNASDYMAVPGQLKRWNKARQGGQLVVNPGLVNRRKYEIQLWNNEWRAE